MWTLLGSTDGRCQFVNNGSRVSIGNNGVLCVKGDLINRDSSLYNAGKVVIGGNCVVNNKSTSRIVNFNGDSLFVFGNFYDSSLFGQNSGVLVLNGANQSLISSSHLLANLALVSSGDKNVLSDLFVRFNLNLQNGHIIVPSASNFGLDSTASLSPALITSNSFVVGTLLRKKITGATDSLFFPIGNTKTAYRPATLMGIASVTGKHPVYALGTNVISPQPGLEVSTVYNRVWGYSTTDSNVAVGNIKVYYQVADVAATPAANLVVAHSKSANGYYNSIGNKSSTSTYVVSELSPKMGYFVLGSSNNLKANFRLFLEGAFNGSAMNTTLFSNLTLKDSLLSVKGMLDGYNIPTDAVDRIMFVAQDSITKAYKDTAYAWVMKDGSIKDYNTGTRNYVTFSKAVATNRYFILVHHRNHLPASSKSIFLSSTTPASYTYDYTKGVYGGGAKYDLSANVWKLYASDAYKSWKNQTDALDATRVGIAFDSGIYRLPFRSYYQATDLNLDGVVDSNDYAIASEHNGKLYYSTLP